MTTARFFVYGSLCEGMVHFSKVQNYIESAFVGHIKAAAFRLKVGYPVILKEGTDWIEGQLLEMRGSDIFLAMMDEFFGYNPQNPDVSLHIRKQTEVRVGDKMHAEKAWVYYLNPLKLPAQIAPIQNGEWKKSLIDNPPITTQLTESQKGYITKLARSTGREIVPIDLSLYRELMNLELIIDKGRRLALSKFGQEVYKYLV